MRAVCAHAHTHRFVHLLLVRAKFTKSRGHGFLLFALDQNVFLQTDKPLLKAVYLPAFALSSETLDEMSNSSLR